MTTCELKPAFEYELSKLDVSRDDLFTKDLWRPYFQRLREEDPVHYHETSSFGPFWSITKYHDIVAIDGNNLQFSSASGITILDDELGIPIESFITSDAPKHGPARKAVQPVVAPKNLEHLESLIRSRASAILDNLPIGQEFNWVDAVSVNLTTQMLATLFGFPFEDRAKLTLWSNNFTDAAARKDEKGREESINLIFECAEYFRELWHRRKSEPTDGFDLISLLQNNPNTANMIDNPMEYLGNIALLIVGGNDTTRNSITGGVLALNQNPEQYEKLRNAPAFIDNMVPEIIRWQTPVIHMRRTALEDVDFRGKLIRKGDKVIMWYISGNRDETAIDNADKFLIDRAMPRRHLSFGFGIHRCMGNRLAEMQLRVLWEEIMERFDYIEVVGPEVRAQSSFIRGYTELPVVLHPK